ncbi:MAG: GtrA family protein [Candidatus Nanoarchaeia archaeon]|nr:GtrA family protein [Candidatus Nanoarchaeia archaeon]
MFGKFISKRFMLYFFIGGFAATVDFASYLILVEIGINYLLAHPIAVWAASTLKFFLNKSITFKNKSKKIFQQYLLSLLVVAVYLAFTEIFLLIFVKFAGLNEIFLKMLVILLGVGLNYGLDKKITFGKMK